MGLIHLATHALVDEESPERSALVVSQPGDGDADGLLTATEIESWSLDAELVTLSACRTAVGRKVSGEGSVSIAYPFLTAGARGVLVSLWPVEDRATPLLMGKFYENWLGEARMSKARALQSAKEWLRSCEAPDGIRRYEHPAYWSSFILVGG